MARPVKFPPQAVIAAIHAEGGMLVQAARRLGCSPMALHKQARKYPEVRQALGEARERTIDLAELRLFEAVLRGEPWAIQCYLTCQGRARGYGVQVALVVR
jgi:transposase-like protein